MAGESAKCCRQFSKKQTIPGSFPFLFGNFHNGFADRRLLPIFSPTPSLHLYYRDFNITTNWSAPVLRLGTLILMGLPLGLLPYPRNDPASAGFHTEAWFRLTPPLRRTPPRQYTGSPWTLPGVVKGPSFDVIVTCFRHLISGSFALVSLNLT